MNEGGNGAAQVSSMTLSGIRRYPVKSCRGHHLDEAVVEPWGIAGDRRWMLVDRDGVEVTARKHPRLLLVTPTMTDAGMTFEGPGAPVLRVPFPDLGQRVSVSIWKDPVDVSLAGEESNAWFSAIVGRDVRLVYLDDPTRRPVDSRYGRDSDRVSFADGFPLLLASESSLAALNRWISPDGSAPPLSMTRFRPSLVVAGAAAWDEDNWRRIRVGDGTFRVAKGCARCVMTTVDPATASRGKEPLATLAKHRRWDNKAWFAVNLIPDTPGVTLHTGDEVEVLDRIEAHGPLR